MRGGQLTSLALQQDLLTPLQSTLSHLKLRQISLKAGSYWKDTLG